MWPFDRIAAEWTVLEPMIQAGPYSVVMFIIASLAIGFGVATFLGRREKNALHAEKNLQTAAINQYKEETGKLAKRISELEKTPEPPTFNNALYGSTLARVALFEIEEKKTTRITGTPADWSPEQINKFAAFQRLRDTGAVNIERNEIWPTQHTVVTSTSTASDMTGFIRRHEQKSEK